MFKKIEYLYLYYYIHIYYIMYYRQLIDKIMYILYPICILISFFGTWVVLYPFLHKNCSKSYITDVCNDDANFISFFVALLVSWICLIIIMFIEYQLQHFTRYESEISDNPLLDF